jgi:hypothetical protein
MHRLHFKYDYQAAILENQPRAITPELIAGSTPNFNRRYIYLLGIFYGFFTRGEHYGPGHFMLFIIMSAFSRDHFEPLGQLLWDHMLATDARLCTTPLGFQSNSNYCHQVQGAICENLTTAKESADERACMHTHAA